MLLMLINLLGPEIIDDNRYGGMIGKSLRSESESGRKITVIELGARGPVDEGYNVHTPGKPTFEITRKFDFKDSYVIFYSRLLSS